MFFRRVLFPKTPSIFRKIINSEESLNQSINEVFLVPAAAWWMGSWQRSWFATGTVGPLETFSQSCWISTRSNGRWRGGMSGIGLGDRWAIYFWKPYRATGRRSEKGIGPWKGGLKEGAWQQRADELSASPSRVSVALRGFLIEKLLCIKSTSCLR